jgi:PAS domain S-box-containing protein
MDMWPGIESTRVFAALRRCMVERTPATMENEFVFPDRTVGWFELSIQPVREGIFILSMDITERRHMEEELRQSEEKYRIIVETANEGIWITDAERKTVLVNQAMAGMLGFTMEEMEGRTPSDFLDAGQESIRVKTSAALKKGGKTHQEFKFRRKDGSDLWVISSASPVFDSEGRYTRTISMLIDITERKRVEVALRESEERFRLFMDNSPTIAWIKDEQGRYVFLSRAFEFRFGVKLDTWLGKTDEELLPAEVAEAFRRNDLAVLDGGQPILVTEEVLDLDGCRSFWLNSKFLFLDSAGYRFVAGIGLDITERKLTEKALSQIREDLDRAQKVGQIGSWRLDVLHNVLTWSDENHRIFGLPKETPLTYETFLETVHPDDRPYVDAQWKASLSGEPYDIEHRIIADGEVKWVREKAYLEFDEAKNLLGGFGITQDISAHKQAEEKIQASLREKETLLRELSHRTKNNLNVISSLISLQIGSLQDPRLADLFRDMQSRILTMSLIHEKLYQSSELSSINIRAYITDLTDAILSGYRVEREKMTVRLEIENILFSIDDVIPCGLIINELMSNSLKYAFPEGRSGEIWITLQQLADEEILLNYRDSGVGFAGGFDWSKTKSLGLKLVQRLVTQQLRGKIEFHAESGPGFLIRFPRSHPQK